LKKTAFEKRVKRKIIAREHTFFASCAPGLKTLLANEIMALNMRSEKIAIKKGGLEFSGKLHDCYTANLKLRCPIRILMRIGRFKAENFSTLEKKLMDLDIELILKTDTKLNFYVSAKGSRLYHTSAIAKRADKILTCKLSKTPGGIITKEKNRPVIQDIFIRAEDDHFEISIDSSGGLLHKRGIKKLTSHAPLRENLAWAVLMFTGFSKNDILIDPMCGSGTFSLEACLFKNNIPPGFYRNFAFQSWQCFRKEKWKYIKQQAQDRFRSCDNVEIFASDIDIKAVSALKKNLSRHSLNNNIGLNAHDFFSINPKQFTEKKGVVVLNPPYGKRVGKDLEISCFYNEIKSKLKKDFKGWRVGIIAPEKRLLKRCSFQKTNIRPFYHGGLDIFLMTGVV